MKRMLLRTIIVTLCFSVVSLGAELLAEKEEKSIFSMAMNEFGTFGLSLMAVGLVAFIFLWITIVPKEREARRRQGEEDRKFYEKMHRDGWGS